MLQDIFKLYIKKYKHKIKLISNLEDDSFQTDINITIMIMVEDMKMWIYYFKKYYWEHEAWSK